MAEWLRRLTRNQMGSTRVGSNPTRSDLHLNVENLSKLNSYKLYIYIYILYFVNLYFISHSLLLRQSYLGCPFLGISRPDNAPSSLNLKSITII